MWKCFHIHIKNIFKIKLFKWLWPFPEVIELMYLNFLCCNHLAGRHLSEISPQWLPANHNIDRKERCQYASLAIHLGWRLNIYFWQLLPDTFYRLFSYKLYLVIFHYSCDLVIYRCMSQWWIKQPGLIIYIMIGYESLLYSSLKSNKVDQRSNVKSQRQTSLWLMHKMTYEVLIVCILWKIDGWVIGHLL